MAVSDQSIATGTQLDQLCINTIRTLSMDAVQKANSGHPGTPMALAPVAYCLWQQFLRYDPVQEGYVVNLDRSRLEGAPTYAANEASLWNDPSYGRRVTDYYGATMVP